MNYVIKELQQLAIIYGMTFKSIDKRHDYYEYKQFVFIDKSNNTYTFTDSDSYTYIEQTISSRM
jgi:hypothetical protein